MNFIDPRIFPSLHDFLAHYGDLQDVTQVKNEEKTKSYRVAIIITCFSLYIGQPSAYRIEALSAATIEGRCGEFYSSQRGGAGRSGAHLPAEEILPRHFGEEQRVFVQGLFGGQCTESHQRSHAAEKSMQPSLFDQGKMRPKYTNSLNC